jgi:hypothetical protein
MTRSGMAFVRVTVNNPSIIHIAKILKNWGWPWLEIDLAYSLV